MVSPTPDADRRARLLSAATATLRDLSEVLTPLGARFAAAGHELYLVGGSVRDAVLGRLGTDLDFTTDARPEQVQALLKGWADNQWDTGIAFGTISAAKADAARQSGSASAIALTVKSRRDRSPSRVSP